MWKLQIYVKKQSKTVKIDQISQTRQRCPSLSAYCWKVSFSDFFFTKILILRDQKWKNMWKLQIYVKKQSKIVKINQISQTRQRCPSLSAYCWKVSFSDIFFTKISILRDQKWKNMWKLQIYVKKQSKIVKID